MDLLVKLYDLPTLQAVEGVTVRLALAHEKRRLVDFVEQHFSSGWASECDVAMGRGPAYCYIAVTERSLVGFACYDAVALGVFGPVGVASDFRGKGIGKALLLSCMYAMRYRGYMYAVIGWASSIQLYERWLPVVEIPGSTREGYGAAYG